eukprot:TRINITY_DN12326_c2_g2_i3.p1 TRINITY_DN12326_c2_g2~~TRINITY_DN12326_c2_g2_i3.p1  ORF type:complete len:1043 (+),score=304.18 TRINITY_DN12326_c2_g2_i3:118-3246(+)
MPSKLDGQNFIKHLRVLQNKYGRVVIDFLVGCVAACKDGITWDELEDVASLNEDLLNAVYAKAPAVPASRRVPAAAWSVLRGELEDFFEEIEVGGCTGLLAFFVDDYLDVVEGELLSDLNLFSTVHEHLAEYFLGTWADDTPKPFHNSDAVISKHHVSRQGQSIRMVASQPMTFAASSSRGVLVGNTRYNKRKLRELPFHLVSISDWDRAIELCFGNFEFMQHSVVVGNLQELVDDFRALPAHVSEPLLPIYNTFREATYALDKDHNQMVAQFAARLLPMEDESVKTLGYFGEFLEHARTTGQLSDMNLFPKHCCLPASTNHTLAELQAHQHAIHGLSAARRTSVYATSSDDKSIKVWQCGRALPLQAMEGLEHWIRAIVVNRDGSRIIAGGTDATVSVYETSTGRVVKRLEGHTNYINAVSLSADGVYAASVGQDGLAFVWDLSRNAVRTQYQQDSPIHAVDFVDDRRIVIGSQDGGTRIIDLDSGTVLNSLLGTKKPVSACIATINGTHIISGAADFVVRVYAMPGRVAGDVKDTDVEFNGHEATITSVSHVGPGSGLFLTSSLDRTVRMWNFMKRQPVARFFTLSPVWAVVSIINESVAVYTCEDGTKGTLTIHKTLDSVRNSKSFIGTEGKWYQRYRPVEPALEIERGAGIALIKQDNESAEEPQEVDLLARFNKVGRIPSLTRSGPASRRNSAIIDPGDDALDVVKFSQERASRDQELDDKRARLKALMEEELSDIGSLLQAEKEPEAQTSKSNSRPSSTLSGDYGFAGDNPPLPPEPVPERKPSANTAQEAEFMVAASRASVSHTHAIFEQGPEQQATPSKAPIEPLTPGKVSKVLQRLHSGAKAPMDDDDEPLAQLDEAEEDAFGQQGYNSDHDNDEVDPVLTTADAANHIHNPSFSPKRTHGEAELMQERGFAGLDTANMSASDVQAAFERMVLGESADVLEMELGTLQRAGRKQKVSTSPMDSNTIRRANRRSWSTPSPTPLARLSQDVEHVVSFESERGSRPTSPINAPLTLTKPLEGTTAKPKEGGCCIIL